MIDLELGPIGQIARSVRDIREAERWYGETLGLKHLYTFGTLAFFDCDGTEEWMAFFKDPEGRPVAIMSQVKGAGAS